jgi:hypothetical protein
MNKFIEQFRKAKEGKLRLIWDGQNERYLITNKPHWQYWPKHELIKKFN